MNIQNKEASRWMSNTNCRTGYTEHAIEDNFIDGMAADELPSG